MNDKQNIQSLIGRTAVDSGGDKIGKIGQVYVDDKTDQPRWVTISTGLFGTRESFAPLQGARPQGEDLQLAVTKDQVKDAPNLDADGHLGVAENEALFAHYAGYSGYDDAAGGEAGSSGRGGNRDTPDGQNARGRDTSGPNTDDAMTRSEEQLRVGTERVESGRVRLRQYVVTENVTQTVPVSHEEVRVEREPITDANRDAAVSGNPITEEEHEIILHQERPVVDKQTVPVERVRLETETVTGEETVSEEVRKERIDTPETDSDR